MISLVEKIIKWRELAPDVEFKFKSEGSGSRLEEFIGELNSRRLNSSNVEASGHNEIGLIRGELEEKSDYSRLVRPKASRVTNQSVQGQMEYVLQKDNGDFFKNVGSRLAISMNDLQVLCVIEKMIGEGIPVYHNDIKSFNQKNIDSHVGLPSSYVHSDLLSGSLIKLFDLGILSYDTESGFRISEGYHIVGFRTKKLKFDSEEARNVYTEQPFDNGPVKTPDSFDLDGFTLGEFKKAFGLEVDMSMGAEELERDYGVVQLVDDFECTYFDKTTFSIGTYCEGKDMNGQEGFSINLENNAIGQREYANQRDSNRMEKILMINLRGGLKSKYIDLGVKLALEKRYVKCQIDKASNEEDALYLAENQTYNRIIMVEPFIEGDESKQVREESISTLYSAMDIIKSSGATDTQQTSFTYLGPDLNAKQKLKLEIGSPYQGSNFEVLSYRSGENWEKNTVNVYDDSIRAKGEKFAREY
jgi:hypothetical protein